MLPTNWPEYLFEGNAMSWIKNKALNYCKGKGLDIGAGRWPLPGAIPVDLHSEMQVCDFPDQIFDFVFSSHTLEHIENWQKVLQEWCAKIKLGGNLFLYLPHEESPWRDSRAHKWTPKPTPIIKILESMGFSITTCTSTPDNYCSFYLVAKKIAHYEFTGS